jgi:hypothetical protein
MTRLIHGPSTTTTARVGLLLLLAVAALGANACERALQVAPSSSVIALSTTATGVALNGSLTITALVTNSSGQPVSDGTLVTFATTLGTLDRAEATVSNGRATVQLLAGTTPGTATVTATSGGVSSNALSLRVGPVASRVVMTSASGSIGSVQVTALVFDANGVAIPGVAVTFATSAGSLSSSTVYADSFGQATTTLYTQTDAVVTASTQGVSTTLAVRPGGSGTLTVNVAISPTDPVRNQTVTFTATTTTIGGGTIPIDHYEWDWGNGLVFITTGNVVSRSWGTEGTYSLTLRVYGYDGSVGQSHIEFYID